MDDVLIKESDYAHFELHENHIFVRHKADIHIDLDAAKIHADIILDLCNGYRYPVILDGRNVTANISHEARKFISGHEPVIRVRSAQAILVNNIPTRLLANFYLKFHKPKHPVKIFSNLEDAERWVAQFKIEKAR
jgi:hypothetical protein